MAYSHPPRTKPTPSSSSSSSPYPAAPPSIHSPVSPTQDIYSHPWDAQTSHAYDVWVAQHQNAIFEQHHHYVPAQAQAQAPVQTILHTHGHGQRNSHSHGHGHGHGHGSATTEVLEQQYTSSEMYAYAAMPMPMPIPISIPIPMSIPMSTSMSMSMHVADTRYVSYSIFASYSPSFSPFFPLFSLPTIFSGKKKQKNRGCDGKERGVLMVWVCSREREKKK